MKTLLLITSLLITTGLKAEPLTEQIKGMWKLTEFYMTAEGKPNKDWCEGMHGSIIYKPNGSMYVTIDCEGFELGSGADNLGGFLFYSGRFEVNEETQQVSHIADKSNDESLLKRHVRNLEIEGDHLTLSGPLGDGKVIVKWKLLEKY